MTTVKSRSAAGPVFQGCYQGHVDSRQTMNGYSESIEGSNHNLSLLGVADCGGPMLLQRDRWAYSPNTVFGDSQGRQGTQLVLSGWPTNLDNPGVVSDGDLNSKGATAISRTIPTNPGFSAVTALRETMADGFPSAPGLESWRERTLRAKNAGSEYLNVEFGWLPLVSDMRNFARSVNQHAKILHELKAGSGKSSRVGYHFPSSETNLITTGNCFIYYPQNSGFSGVTPSTVIEHQRSETWFKGAFKYILPLSDDMFSKAQLYVEYADKLLGVKPTPDAIYNSSPWSWALDWFTNTGDIITNISRLGQNGMVLQYGYMMSYSSTKTIVNAAAGGGFGGFTAGSVTHLREWKKRLPANPYGFGVTDLALTASQKAIALALAISQGGRHGR
ncbi:TPA_asm: maturation protein [ssRNA phage Gerhypos.2_25]|jgi:hypothetical protein|uniref:Maturation protein n=2 Tax=Leviviricetes TaxID=2842243 RepID=A0A8S5L1D1_9VIRU|nr:maturation protein [ssRNA phage Gerhypos.2_25]QDH87154.1 MAG: hypothetical protein H2Bulk35362_000003 [Leviviridae sp.]QDH91308.1 MAG: hypothetical protein H1BulkLitter61154_000003 [Leviviridae sp.]DAD51408.1 TPA_asm: maturation protein [ssRNA phage Gerhypos.2_25]